MTWWQRLTRRSTLERRLHQELRFHLEQRTADLIASGHSAVEARRLAQLEFGGLEQIKEQCRDARGTRWLERWIQDSRHALRTLRKSPGFSLIALLILASSGGAVIAAFHLVDALFLRPLPVAQPRELVEIYTVDRMGRDSALPSKVLERLRADSAFSGVCGFVTPKLGAEIAGEAQSVGALAWTGDCFETLGIRPQIGRTFSLADDHPGAGRVAWISDALWRSAFQARPDDQMPVGPPPANGQRQYFWSTIYARRAPGVSLEQARARIAVQQRQLLEYAVPLRYNEAQRRDYFARKVNLRPAETGVDYMLRRRFGDPLLAVLALCASVLLIAWVNVSILLLARCAARHREFAMRLALGARRWAIARLIALESGFVALAGTAGGFVVAVWIRQWVSSAAAAHFSVMIPDGSDRSTLWFIGGLTALAIVALSAAPLFHIARFSPDDTLTRTGRGTVGTGTRMQKLLLAVQVSLTLTLVSAAATFTASMRTLDRLDLGYRPAGLSEALLAPRPAAARAPIDRGYRRELLAHLSTLPGVAHAALSDHAPLWHHPVRDVVSSPDIARLPAEIQAHRLCITEDYFATMGIPLMAGRAFQDIDRDGPERAVIVSQPLAEALGGTVIGHRIHLGSSPALQNLRIIGIAAPARLDLENPEVSRPFTAYLNLWQFPDRQTYSTLLVRSITSTAVSPKMLRDAVDSRGREYVDSYRTMSQARDGALVENQVLASLASSFGILTLVLAATGLFGLLSYQVMSRTAEIGIRIALGARPVRIHWMIARQVLPLLGGGLLSGLALTFSLSKVMARLVYGTRASDPGLLLLSCATLLASAVAAAVIPARRASSVDPATALRQE